MGLSMRLWKYMYCCECFAKKRSCHIMWLP
nr:MAG TPA: hypothetical protein [Caudoviricetes sp.]